MTFEQKRKKKTVARLFLASVSIGTRCSVESGLRRRADPRLLGVLRKTVLTRGVGVRSSGYERMNETHLSVFHSALNHAHGKRSRNSVSSAARYTFNSLFSRLYDIHVT